MSSVNERECEAEGVDPRQVARIARGLSRYAKELEAMGLQVFGGGTGGSIRGQGSTKGRLILAHLNGDFDGGDGAGHTDEDGLLRAES